MTSYLYEHDQVPEKYRILVALRHDSLVRRIADELDIPVQELRNYLITHLDMIQLENLPARAEMAEADADNGDEIARALGREKYTRYVRIIPGAAMDPIIEDVKARVRAGTSVDAAIAHGRERIRRVLRQ